MIAETIKNLNGILVMFNRISQVAMINDGDARLVTGTIYHTN